MIHIVVDQKPTPKARPRFSRKSKSVYTPSKTTRYESHIKQTARKLIAKPFTGAIDLVVSFNFKKARTSKLLKHTKKPDIDNLLKSVMDALNKVAWVDDSQVVRVRAEKNFSEFDGLQIVIQELE